MKRKTDLPELLAPAGDMEALYAAVAAGADAVYVGGKLFSARAYAKNFDLEELARAVIFCHMNGVRLYVTVNTLIYDKEADELIGYCKELARIGVDALIIADLGAIRRIRREVPGLALHASTQMSLHNTPATEVAYSLGCERAVLARECSLREIRSAVEHSPCEIEVFLHGALCVCHSGQCLFSSMVGGRSGNRGECAQPCRLPYNGSYPLSLSDLSLAGHIGELIDSGVSSLKIEGRMKSPDYVYRVTSIYRRLLDERRNAGTGEHASLAAVFSRGGFTDGYFTGHPEQRMTGVRSEQDKEATRAEQTGATYAPVRHKIYATARFLAGEPASLSLTDGVRTASAFGEIPAPALSAPLTAPDLKARLSKLGATFFSLAPEDIALELSDGVNLSPSAINALRRAAAAALEEQFAAPLLPQKSLPALPDDPPKADLPEGSSALFLDPALPGKISDLLGDFAYRFLPLFRLSEAKPGIANGVYLPPVLMDSELPAAREALKRAKAQGIAYALVGNLGGIALAKEAGLLPIGDFRLNIMNRETASVYRSLGVSLAILSPELTLPMARDLLRGSDGLLFAYGRVPLMLTERCFVKENFGCESCGRAALTDRKGQKFPILREYDHRNLIFNSAVTYMGDRGEDLRRAGVRRLHFLFSTENERQAREAIEGFRKGTPLPQNIAVRRIGKRETNA